eukprot:142736_1
MKSGLFGLLTIVAIQFLMNNLRYVSSSNYGVATSSTTREQHGKRSVCEFCCKIPENLRRCSWCKMVSYCNTHCQKNDWELLHKNICKHIKNYSLSTKSPKNRDLFMVGYSRPIQMPNELYSLINEYAKTDIVGFKIDLFHHVKLDLIKGWKARTAKLVGYLQSKHLECTFESDSNEPGRSISLKASVSLGNSDTKIILGVAFERAIVFNFGAPFKIILKSDRSTSEKHNLGMNLLDKFLACDADCADSVTLNAKVYEYSKTPQYQDTRSYQDVIRLWLPRDSDGITAFVIWFK